MDINRLRYFSVIAKTENLHAASEILYISPPALSKAMKTLEIEMGQELLQNAGRGIRLTEKGQLLASRIAFYHVWNAFTIALWRGLCAFLRRSFLALS